MKQRKFINSTKRSFVVIGIITFLFAALFFRLGFLMIVRKNFLVAKAESQSSYQQTIMPKRGSILDTNGQQLAVSGDVYKLSLDLLEVHNYADTKSRKTGDKPQEIVKDIADKFADILGKDKKEVEEFMEKTNDQGVYPRGLPLARKIEKSQIDKIKELRDKNSYNFVIIENDTNRYYPNNNFLAQVLGGVDLDGKGLFGLEQYYNKDLTGVPGVSISQVDRKSRDLPYSNQIYTQPVNGKDLTTSIDSRIQYICEKIAEKTMESTKAKGVNILVTDPKTGEILAMVNKPDFNPNDPKKGITDNNALFELWRNKAVNDVYEPGSTFKLVTMSAALEENLTYRDDQFYDKGYVIVDGVRINCWKDGGHGAENLVDLLKNSCNPGFIELGKRLGKEKMNSYIEKFGFGKQTGIDFPGEAAGIVKSTSTMSNVDLATISFGQTDAASMVQLIGAINAVFNNGVYTTPHFMKNLSQVDADGNRKVVATYEEKNSRQVISQKTANTVAGFLEETVSKGSGKLAYIEGYGVAGKTGTAQKANIGGKGYGKDVVASFIGGAPYNNPKISLLVTIDSPEGIEHMGGEIAAPVAHDLFDQIFRAIGYDPTKK
ncbi:penicillin-binding transpeptidase domain-containing protein [Clostridium fungisolvens]|uniref:Stage V sporulation protein D n=1 Tax=Clostridium fungisolvens TaxID=1604897 RepID=A0A6V8SKY1_9CLOT|nr:penicillin-binding transpeptidase domain-containing protein [Clostridium fungisolvens]GFP77894.1 Stage V sporulation protein D [Clostridium fungisolvens]